ncbi:hypothetical protein M9Y10_033219 [Tritrichomonas musculus]|uniref:C2 domain-containing protein n=1 Tax=Tritrichomonas musculus TaxID=1915356 RepID=A0ABR2GYF0_9EUKA
MKKLFIKAIEATDVPKMDVIGKSDPYLLFRLSTTSETWKTSYIKNNHSPVWNEDFRLPLASGMSVQLTVELYDKDDVSKDDIISKMSFDVSKFPFGKVIDEWYDFTPVKGVSKGGKVHLAFCVDDPSNRKFIM